MQPYNETRVGYVVKRYPRYSETFIVNEIIAHERAGLDLEIYALRPPNDTHFQDAVSRVRAPVIYLPSDGVKAADFWKAIEESGSMMPDLFAALEAARGEEAMEVFQAVTLARLARERGLTHLHAHFASSATSVARLAARFAGLPYSFTAHAKDIFHEGVKGNDLERKLAEAKTVVTVSDFNLRFLRETFGPAAARVERIYNGLDLDQFPFRSLAGRSRRIISVGRLVEKKGFADLITACALLRARGFEFSCMIVGTGQLESELRDQIFQLGLQSVIELSGPRPQRVVIQLVQESCAFAAPCVIGADGNRDGLPTVLLEAMALGTPCVSTDVTGIPEILRDRETGLMVPQHEPEALAAALERLLTSPQLAASLAVRARRVIESEFSIERNAASQRELFTSGERTRILQEVA